MNDKKNQKLSKIDLIVHLIVKVRRDDIFALASQLAYYLVLAFFPFLVFLITLIGFSELNPNEVLEGLSTILPTSVFDLTEGIVTEVVQSQNTGLLGASILLAIWTASSGFRGVIKGVNKAYDIQEHRSFVKRTIIAIICTIALAITIICALTMLVFGDIIGRYLLSVLPFNNVLSIVWNLLRYLVIILMMIFIFAAIYKFTPSKKLKWREVIPGAVVSTLGWVIVSLGFAYYINTFANYSRFYGSLGAVFILMTWLFLTSIILIFGVEINSVLVKNKKRLA